MTCYKYRGNAVSLLLPRRNINSTFFENIGYKIKVFCADCSRLYFDKQIMEFNYIFFKDDHAAIAMPVTDEIQPRKLVTLVWMAG